MKTERSSSPEFFENKSFYNEPNLSGSSESQYHPADCEATLNNYRQKLTSKYLGKTIHRFFTGDTIVETPKSKTSRLNLMILRTWEEQLTRWKVIFGITLRIRNRSNTIRCDKKIFIPDS